MNRTTQSRVNASCCCLLFIICVSGFSWLPCRAQSSQNPAAPPAQMESAPPTVHKPTTAYTLPPERLEKAVSYSRAWYKLYFFSAVWNISALLALLWSGFFAKLRDLAESKTSQRSLQTVIFSVPVFLMMGLLNLPLLAFWHHVSLGYGQSIQPWSLWLLDWCKGQALNLGLALVIVLSLFALIRWKPGTWWFYAWLGTIPLSVFLVFITPWYIDPIFNKFRPLEESNPQLVRSIGELARRAGLPIPAERMFLMEASVKTNAINAYVTGVGASKRIVIWDTSIKKTKPDELLFVVGHEIGHYVLGHVVKGLTYFLALLLAAIYVAFRLLQWLIVRWGSAWGVHGQTDLAALGILLLLLNVLGFFGEPIGNAISRTQEHAADAFSLELIHGYIPNANEVAAHAFQVLGEEDLEDPSPSKFITIWLYSHPPLADRLRFAHEYVPATTGTSAH